MELYTTIIIIAGGALGTYLISRVLSVYQKIRSVQQQVQQRGNQKRTKTLQDWLDDLPMAYQQAQAVYQETLNRCNAQKLTPEQTREVLKPIVDRLHFLETIDKYKPLVQVGATIGDQVLKNIGDMF